MLQYKNHRFCCEGVSFAIPDGYYLETDYEESPEDTLHLWSQDQRLHLCVGIERGTKGPLQELTYILRELEQCVVLEGPSAVNIGGLAGYMAAYASGDKKYWEIHLGVSGLGDEQIGLIILVSTHGKLPTKEEIEALMNAVSPCRE